MDLEAILPLKRIIKVEQCNIGIIHGHNYGGTAVDNAVKAFKDDNVDCVVFGHSHIPVNKLINNVRYFNPGSAMDKRRQEKHTLGFLKVQGKNITGEIVEID